MIVHSQKVNRVHTSEKTPVRQYAYAYSKQNLRAQPLVIENMHWGLDYNLQQGQYKTQSTRARQKPRTVKE